MKEAREALEKEKEEWQKCATNLEATQLADPIVFNVGGTLFATSMETLMKIENTYFTGLLSGRWDLKCSKTDGSIFIDRDPAVFGSVINYLRDYPIPLATRMALLTPEEKELLVLDAEFYMIPQLAEYVDIEIWSPDLLQSYPIHISTVGKSKRSLFCFPPLLTTATTTFSSS